MGGEQESGDHPVLCYKVFRLPDEYMERLNYVFIMQMMAMYFQEYKGTLTKILQCFIEDKLQHKHKFCFEKKKKQCLEQH